MQFDNSGDYVHSAPWSVADQGKRDVSHGCINISPSNAKWFFDNFGAGDPIVVKNSVGTYSKNDGSNDWQMLLHESSLHALDASPLQVASSRSGPAAAGRGTARRSR